MLIFVNFVKALKVITIAIQFSRFLNILRQGRDREVAPTGRGFR